MQEFSIKKTHLKISSWPQCVELGVYDMYDALPVAYSEGIHWPNWMETAINWIWPVHVILRGGMTSDWTCYIPSMICNDQLSPDWIVDPFYRGQYDEKGVWISNIRAVFRVIIRMEWSVYIMVIFFIEWDEHVSKQVKCIIKKSKGRVYRKWEYKILKSTPKLFPLRGENKNKTNLYSYIYINIYYQYINLDDKKLFSILFNLHPEFI